MSRVGLVSSAIPRGAFDSIWESSFHAVSNLWVDRSRSDARGGKSGVSIRCDEFIHLDASFWAEGGRPGFTTFTIMPFTRLSEGLTIT